jgi:tetratricopeptide (TPR) repeat protein
LKSGETDRACTQFGYVVKGAPGHEFHAESLLQYGQLLLERGNYQDAAFQFRRATEAEKYPACQAKAAVYLGMTYFMMEKYQEAGAAVLAQRVHFDDPSVRNAAALVTSLARWKATSGELQAREASFMYRTLIVVSGETDWFGYIGQLLIGRLYAELGFDDQMLDHYSKQLARGVPPLIEEEMKFSIASRELAHDRTDEAVKIWKELSDHGSEIWSNRAKLRLAERSLAGDRAQECVDICHSIRAGVGVTKKEMLKLMGRAFEQLGDDRLAARCFAGHLPKE